jgi:hypothetical protein
VNEIGFDAIQRPVIDQKRKLLFFFFVLLVVNVLLAKVPALEPGL